MRTIKVIATIRTGSGLCACGEEMEIKVADNIEEVEEHLIVENAVHLWKESLMLSWDYMDELSLQAEAELPKLSGDNDDF